MPSLDLKLILDLKKSQCTNISTGFYSEIKLNIKIDILTYFLKNDQSLFISFCFQGR